MVYCCIIRIYPLRKCNFAQLLYRWGRAGTNNADTTHVSSGISDLVRLYTRRFLSDSTLGDCCRARTKAWLYTFRRTGNGNGLQIELGRKWRVTVLDLSNAEPFHRKRRINPCFFTAIFIQGEEMTRFASSDWPSFHFVLFLSFLLCVCKSLGLYSNFSSLFILYYLVLISFLLRFLHLVILMPARGLSTQSNGFSS